MPILLSIAGFDPSSGAGITADLKVFAAHACFGTAAITALTVQSTLGVRAVYPLPAEQLVESLNCLDHDLPPDGIKLGMLANAAIVNAVADYLTGTRYRTPRAPIVLDPVLWSSSGGELIDPEGFHLLRGRLLPLVDWITPNWAELSALSGRPIPSPEAVPGAASALQQQYPRLTILATGGDAVPPNDLLCLPRTPPIWLTGEHVRTSSTHGTGCALSSALLCHLALGTPPEAAARVAKAYVAQALRSATPIGHGTGPLNHLWPL